jgi:hypothetical protein
LFLKIILSEIPPFPEHWLANRNNKKPAGLGTAGWNSENSGESPVIPGGTST